MSITKNTNNYTINEVLISTLLIECQNSGLLYTCQMMDGELRVLIEKVRNLGIKIKLLTLQKYILNAYKTANSVPDFYKHVISVLEPLNIQEQEYQNLLHFVKELQHNKILY